MAAGGLVLEDLAESERAERGLEPQALALRVKHVGQYGDHAVALRAGFQKDDLIVRFDDRAARLSESQFLAQALTYPPGHVLQVEVLRGRQTKRLKLPLQYAPPRPFPPCSPCVNLGTPAAALAPRGSSAHPAGAIACGSAGGVDDERPSIVWS
jgi:hypothetical protein